MTWVDWFWSVVLAAFWTWVVVGVVGVLRAPSDEWAALRRHERRQRALARIGDEVRQ